MNPRFAGLFDAIEHKTYSKPELGRILTDKGYANCKDYKPQQVALWAFVKENQQVNGRKHTKSDASLNSFISY